MGGSNGSRAPGCALFQPTDAQVDELIRRASQHSLGSEFLREGSIEAAAAIFETHAFTVEAARRKLAQKQVKNRSAKYAVT